MHGQKYSQPLQISSLFIYKREKRIPDKILEHRKKERERGYQI